MSLRVRILSPKTTIFTIKPINIQDKSHLYNYFQSENTTEIQVNTTK